MAKRGNEVVVTVTCAEGSPELVGSHVLLAVGRIPNTSDLGLDKAGIATDERGYVIVDDQLQTNVPGILALGDCNGRGAFTHTSYNDYEIVAHAETGLSETWDAMPRLPRAPTDSVHARRIETSPGGHASLPCSPTR